MLILHVYQHYASGLLGKMLIKGAMIAATFDYKDLSDRNFLETLFLRTVELLVWYYYAHITHSSQGIFLTG